MARIKATTRLRTGSASLNSTGLRRITGSGAVAAQAATVEGVGSAETITGDGSLEAQAAAVAGSGTVNPAAGVSWSAIPDPLPDGVSHNMLQYLNDPSGVIQTTQAQGLSGDASYDPATGVLTYGTSQQTGIEMVADDSQSGSGVFDPTDVAGLWAWADVSDERTSITTSSFNNYPNISAMTNIATPGTNDFSQADNERRPGYAASGFSIDGYSTALPPIAVENVPGSGNVYGQAMEQSGSLGAAGEFYLVAVVGNTRSDGIRYMLGSDTSNMVRLNQEKPNDHLLMAIAGSGETQICPDGSIPSGASLIEIWRDASNVIHVAVNGSEVGSDVNMAGTLNLSGYGGGSFNWDSAWDDWLMTFLAFNALPDATTRQQIRDFVNTRWGVY